MHTSDSRTVSRRRSRGASFSPSRCRAATARSSASPAGRSRHARARLTRPDYRLFAYTEEFGAALGACDLVLARAGGSVWEIAAAGRPAVLIPGLFATGDHQTKNARYFERAGAAVVVPEQDAGRAPEVVRSLLDDPRRLGDMAQAMLRAARPDAADEIAEELIALA